MPGSTRGFHRAGNDDVFGELRGVALQRVPLGIAVLIVLPVIGEVRRTKIGCPGVEVGEQDVGADAGLFPMEFPAKADPPE